MFREEKPKSVTTVGKLIFIVAVLGVMLILDIFLATVIFVTKPRENLISLLFVEGIIFVLVGALRAVRGADTPMDVFIALRRGVHSRADPLREGYAGKKMTFGELAVDVVLVVIGAVLIGLAFIIH